MAGSSVAIKQSNSNPVFDRTWAELGFAQPTPRVIERDILEQPDEQDDTDWQDFLGYHSEVLR